MRAVEFRIFWMDYFFKCVSFVNSHKSYFLDFWTFAFLECSRVVKSIIHVDSKGGKHSCL